MVHYSHNQFIGTDTLLILIGCFMFVTAPLYLVETPELGGTAIVAGFVIGGIGFYKRYQARKQEEEGGGGSGPHKPS